MIDEGTAPASDSTCSNFTVLSPASTFTGTLAAFATGKTDFASGRVPPAGGTLDRSYRIRYTLNSNVPNSQQGGTASVEFWWEAQNS